MATLPMFSLRILAVGVAPIPLTRQSVQNQCQDLLIIAKQ